MKKHLWILFLGALLTACGGISSHEDAVEETLDVMDDMIDVLEGIEDADDAEDAKDELKAIGERMSEIAKAVKELPKADKDEQKRLQKLMQEGMQERQKKISEIVGKMSPEALMKLGTAMQDAMKGVDFR